MRPCAENRAVRVIGLGFVMLVLAGCDGLLDVELPGRLVEEDVFTPDNAELIVSSAIADFECAYSMMSATLTGMGDANWASGGFGSTHAQYGIGPGSDLRPGSGHCPDNSDTGSSWWHGLERSRLFAERGYRHLREDWTDVENRERLMATAAVYAGLVYDVLGSTFCEYAFPESELLPPSDVLRRGEEWLTTALDHMETQDFSIEQTESLRQLALMARARIRRTLQDYSGAEADARMIEPGFEAWVTRDGSERGRWNEVYNYQVGFRYRTVAGPIWWYGHEPDRLVSAGYQDLTIAEDGRQTVDDGVPDPRVPEEYTGSPMPDGVTPFHRQEKYTSVSDWQRMASWEEAQLILAELERGQAAVDRINAIRDEYDLPHFSSSDPDEIYSAIVEERRREFFLEGARHYMDKLRYGFWFPRGQGVDHKGDRYGFAYCLLMPENAYELNENVPADYTGVDLSDRSYTWELEIDDKPQWPVPSELPFRDVMEE